MLNLSDYKEHFCEYILFRYAWANIMIVSQKLTGI